MWCIAELDADYIGKMEDVLRVYEQPYKAAEPVLCLDEKPVTLHADIRPVVAAAPGKIAKRDNEYKRCGTANVFCAVEPKCGRHFIRVTPNRSGPEFAQAVEQIIRAYPFARRIHLVMDNLSTHQRKFLIERFGQQEGGYLWNRLQLHYTPKHGSWLNQAEIEISLFSRQCLGRRRIPDLQILRQEARAWSRRMNRHSVKIDWQFTRKDARAKFRYESPLSTRSQT